MIQVLTPYPIDDILQNPEDYIDEGFDTLLLRFVHDASNPVSLLLGYDDKEKLYYFVLEDNEVSEDFYCRDGNLEKMFDEIMQGKGDYEIWMKG